MMFFGFNRNLWIALGSLSVSLVLGISLLSGCGKGHPTELPADPEDRGPVADIPAASKLDAGGIALTGELKCLNPQECHPSVGMLVIIIGGRPVANCTAFLVDDDLIATNRHCLPRDLQKTGARLEGRAQVVFAASDSVSSESIALSEVVNSSEFFRADQAIAPDYAIVRLKRVANRQPLTISSEGFSNGQVLEVVKMNPIAARDATGELRTSKCRVVFGSMILPQFTNPISPVGTLGDCEIRPGNAGAPLIDENGFVHGLIQASYVPGGVSSQGVIGNDRFQAIVLEPTAPLSLATSFACIDSKSFEPFNREGCLVDYSSRKTDDLSNRNLQEESRKADLSISVKFAELARNAGGEAAFFQWTGSAMQAQSKAAGPQRSRFLPVPKCFTPSEAPEPWLSRYRNFLGAYKKKAHVNLQIEVWYALVGVNQYLQPAHQIHFESKRPLSVEFHPAALHKSGESSVEIRSSDLPDFIGQKVDLGFCDQR